MSDNKSEPTPVHFFNTYTKQFEDVFPYYLSVGMTYEQFWEQDCNLVKFYRKADKIRHDEINYKCWLQGMYIYEAICDASPILQAFAKKGTKPVPFPNKPYCLTAEDKQKDEEDKAKNISQKGKDIMLKLMSKKKQEGGDAIEQCNNR